MTASHGTFSVVRKAEIWNFTNSNTTNLIRKVTVWKPQDHSYLVSVYLPIIISQKNILETLFSKVEKLPEHVRIEEGAFEDRTKPPSEWVATEWVVKAFDTKACYIFLQKIFPFATAEASQEITSLLEAMKIRYQISL